MKLISTIIIVLYSLSSFASATHTVHFKNLTIPDDIEAFKLTLNKKGNPKPPRLQVVNGQSASNDQFPFVAELSININGLCTASILNENWLLTARHCVDMPNLQSILVRFGSADRQSTRVEIFASSFTYLTPSDGSYQDIALIHLSQSVTYNNNIKPIRLPTLQKENFGYEGYTFTAIGWGVDKNGATQRYLQYADFKVLTQSQCTYDMGPYCLCSKPIVSIAHVTGGDSGGPAIITESDGIETLIAVNVKYLKTDVMTNVGSTRVTSYLRWIQQVTGVTLGATPSVSDGLVPVGTNSACLSPGQKIISPSGCFTLSFQTDGNVVLYTNTNGVLWASNTYLKTATRFCMQADGNLVLYNVNTPLWSSGTDGQTGARLQLQNDGNLVIYKNNIGIWATGTDQQSYPAKC